MSQAEIDKLRLGKGDQFILTYFFEIMLLLSLIGSKNFRAAVILTRLQF